MSNPRFLKWLHRIGYICTALVAVELAVVTYFDVWATLERHKAIAMQMEDTRTREGPLTGGNLVRADALALLKPLPPLTALGRDGLRFVSMPQLSRFYYALSLASSSGDAEGVLIVTERLESGKTNPTAQHFTMSRAAYTALMADLDRQTDGFAGIDSGNFCMDGTAIAFERIRGRHITSGIGNGGCFPHYRAISDKVRAAILHIVTPSGPPIRGGWYPTE
ncbi:MAG: hypothetical protein V4559_01630 [Pseudomonadota bacterium]